MATTKLRAVGPIDARTGFPLWYEDGAGRRLGLGLNLDPGATPDPNLPAVGDLQPGPIVFPTNFPDEAFYFMAEARMPVGGAGVVGRARLILALEAAFGGTGVPAAGKHVVFARIRVRMDDLVPGARYRVTHPYGVETDLEADDRGRVFWTDDRGIADGDVERVLGDGLVAPFLSWVTGAPAGYLGDGVSERPVTGSPNGTNYFKVEGPRIREGGGPPDPDDPGNPDVVRTDLFTVQGRFADRPGHAQLGARPVRAVYTPTATGATIDVTATTAPGQNLELATPRAAFTARDRLYSVRVQVPAVPTHVEVVNIGDEPTTRARIPVSDLVTVHSATWSTSSGTLTIDATSCDPGAVLTARVEVPGFRPDPAQADPRILGVVSGATSFSVLTAVPARVVVESDRGGQTAADVQVDGPAATTLPVLADAGPEQSAIPGQVVTLDGTGSRGAITAWAWTQTGGDPVTLSDPAVANPTFTAGPTVQTLSFDLTVTGDGGSSTDTVTVAVGATPAPDVVDIARAEFRTGRRQFRVTGTVVGAPPNVVTISVAGSTLSTGLVAPDGTFDVRHTLTAAQSGLVPGVGSTLVATTDTGTDTAIIDIRN